MCSCLETLGTASCMMGSAGPFGEIEEEHEESSDPT